MEPIDQSKEGVPKRCEYDKKEFWDKRFTEYYKFKPRTSGFFDWYVGWDELKNYFLVAFYLIQ